MNTLHQHQLPEVTYLSRWLRWLIAIAVGVLMVYLSEPDSWYNLHLFDGYVLAMMASCLVSIGLTKIVNYLSIWLDKRMSWTTRPWVRLMLQLGLGFFIPIAIAVLAMWYYFDRYGLTLSQTTYFDRVFSPLCLFVMLANAYYPLHFFIQLYRTNVSQKTLPPAVHELMLPSAAMGTPAEMSMPAKTLKLPKNYEVHDILLIVSVNRGLYSYSAAGEKLQWENTIKLSISLLPRADFFKISKSAIVQRANIVKAQHCSSNCIELLLRIPKNQTIRVSQRNCAKFCLWYGQPVLPSLHKG